MLKWRTGQSVALCRESANNMHLVTTYCDAGTYSIAIFYDIPEPGCLHGNHYVTAGFCCIVNEIWACFFFNFTQNRMIVPYWRFGEP